MVLKTCELPGFYLCSGALSGFESRLARWLQRFIGTLCYAYAMELIGVT